MCNSCLLKLTFAAIRRTHREPSIGWGFVCVKHIEFKGGACGPVCGATHMVFAVADMHTS